MCKWLQNELEGMAAGRLATGDRSEGHGGFGSTETLRGKGKELCVAGQALAELAAEAGDIWVSVLSLPCSKPE